MILIVIGKNDKTQTEVADLVIKGYALMTRIISLMVSKKYLNKAIDNQDRRKAKLKVTNKGKKIISQLRPMIVKNRETALVDISSKELQQLFTTLQKITKNCINEIFT